MLLPPPLQAEVIARLRAAGCVFAEDEARLLLDAAATPEELESMVDQRVTGLPLEHILGWAEFAGLRIRVDSRVFVPRRRSEFLVQEALSLSRTGMVLVDLCCGTGAVAAAIAAGLGSVEVYAVDIDPAAVACARRNLADAGGRVYEGDLYTALPPTLRGRVDVIVANAPYVPTEAVALMPPEARLHEAREALDGGADGLDIARRVAQAAPRWLVDGGHLLIETSEQQAPALVDAATDAGLAARSTHSEELDGTVMVATKPRTS